MTRGKTVKLRTQHVYRAKVPPSANSLSNGNSVKQKIVKVGEVVNYLMSYDLNARGYWVYGTFGIVNSRNASQGYGFQSFGLV